MTNRLIDLPCVHINMTIVLRRIDLPIRALNAWFCAKTPIVPIVVFGRVESVRDMANGESLKLSEKYGLVKAAAVGVRARASDGIVGPFFTGCGCASACG